MIILIELFAKPFSHMVVVKSLIKGLQQKKDCTILFISSEEYYKTIPDEYKTCVTFINVKSNPYIKGNILQLLIGFKYILKFRKNSPKLIFLTSKVYANLVLKFISLFFIKLRILCFLHGELSVLSLKKFVNTRQRLSSISLRILIWLNSKLSSKMKLIVISEFVFNEMVKKLNFNVNNVLHVNMPYYFEPKPEIEINSESLVLTSIGVSSRLKNSHLINDLAKELKREIQESKIELKIAGRVEGFKPHPTVQTIKIESGALLDESQYSKILLASSLFIFFNDNNYNLVSSASYFDCLEYCKPIIALQNEQWQYNFDNFGNIGLLYNSLEELITGIKQIIENPEIINGLNEQVQFAKSSYTKKVQLNHTFHDAILEF